MTPRYVPVLDDDYMKRREAQKAAEFQWERLRYMNEQYARDLARSDARRTADGLEAAKQRFIDGDLDLKGFEAEVDRHLRKGAG